MSEQFDDAHQQRCIVELRTRTSPLIVQTQFVDTDCNLQRWLLANEFNVDKTTHKLSKHLRHRMRREHIDSWQTIDANSITSRYAPWNIVGENRVGGDRLVLVDAAGRIDIAGVLKSVQLSGYLNEKHRSMEQIMHRLNEMEAKVGRRCSAIIIFDLDGLQFDASLLSVVTGPFRLTWSALASHYRDWIETFVVINSPTFINVLWAAFSPFVPEKFKARVIFASSSDWQAQLLELIDADHLPARYGGRLDDSVLVDPTAVPKELYWSAPSDYPSVEDMVVLSVPAAGKKMVGYEIVEDNTYMELYLRHKEECSFAIYYTDNAEITDIKAMENVWIETIRAGLTSIDRLRFDFDRRGYYYIKFGNEAAWLMSVTIKYHVRMFDSNARAIEQRQLQPAENSSWWF